MWIVSIIALIIILTLPGHGKESTKCEALLNECNKIAWLTVEGNATARDLANCDYKFEKECENGK